MKLRRAIAMTITITLAWGCLGAWAQTAAVAEAEDTSPPAQVQRPDESRSDTPFTTTLFGRPVEWGLSYEVSQERRQNFDFDSRVQRDRDVLEHELKFDARWRTGAASSVFVQGLSLAERRTSRRDGSVQSKHSFERGQTWVLFENLGGQPLSLQLGRIALVDARSWWWDEDLDAVRLRLAAGAWRLDTGVAREVARVTSALPGIESTAQGITRWFGDAQVKWAGAHTLGVLWLLADDRSGAPAAGALFDEDREDAEDAQQRWWGLRANGEVRNAAGHRFSYRADAALVRGRVTRTAFAETPAGPLAAGTSAERTVRAHAWDVGLQWRMPGSARPTFSVAAAQGSGADDSGRVDRNFQQTGLHENKGRVAGVKRVRYYGELLDPELSNLRIATLGFGLRVLPRSSIELLAHRYRQQVASTRLAGARPSARPLGLDRDIGREVDLVLALREMRWFELLLKLSRFNPGKAYAVDRRAPAQSAEVVLTFTF